MRTLLVGAALAALLVTSCTKENDRPAPTPAGTVASSTFFQFRVNGKQYEAMGATGSSPVKGVKIVRSADGRSHNLYAWLEEPFQFFVKIPMPETLVPGTYQFSENHGAAGEVRVADLLNATYALGQLDQYTVTITRVGNGTADGSFSATGLSRVGGDARAPQTVKLTQGRFEDVRVY